MAAVLVVGVATLTPRPDQVDMVARTPVWCLVCGGLGGVDVLLNVVLFAPFGAALRLRGSRLARIATLSLALSVTVELLQALIPGRDPTLSDLVTNTTGGVLGGFIVERWRHLAHPHPTLARYLASVWGALWLMQTGFTAAAVQPSLPRSWYWGQLAPDLGQFEQFTGRVQSASIGAHRIRIGRLATSAEVREALLMGQPLLGTTTPGEATAGLAPIVSIFDGEQREIVLLGRWGNDLVYRLRTRSYDLRFQPPAVRLAAVFAGTDTDSTTVAGRFDRAAGTLVVSNRNPRRASERVVPLSTQWGWSLLLPFPYAHGVESGWITAGWLAAWMLPLGWWAGRASRWIGLLAAIAVLLLLGLVVIPSSAGLQVRWSAEMAPALGALAMGGRLARSASRAPKPDPAPIRQT